MRSSGHADRPPDAPKMSVPLQSDTRNEKAEPVMSLRDKQPTPTSSLPTAKEAEMSEDQSNRDVHRTSRALASRAKLVKQAPASCSEERRCRWQQPRSTGTLLIHLVRSGFRSTGIGASASSIFETGGADQRRPRRRRDCRLLFGHRLGAHLHRRHSLDPSLGEHLQRGAARASPRGETRPSRATPGWDAAVDR